MFWTESFEIAREACLSKGQFGKMRAATKLSARASTSHTQRLVALDALLRSTLA